MPIIAANHLSTGALISTDDFPVLFWIELGGELGRIDQVAEHHRELPTFCFGCTRFYWYRDVLRSWNLFSNRLRRSLVGSAGRSLEVCGGTRPREASLICLYLRFMDIEEFPFQVFQVGIIQIKASLEGTVGYPSLAFEERDHLFQDVVKRHDRSSANASKSAFASFRSVVSKPSVNQLYTGARRS